VSPALSPPLDGNARAVIQMAERLSEQQRHGYLSCEHLFLALVKQESWLEEKAAQAGASIETLEERTWQWIEPGDGSPLWEGRPVSPRLERVLKRAASLAAGQGAVATTPHHMLEGLVDEGKGIPQLVLNSLGIDPAWLLEREGALPPGRPPLVKHQPLVEAEAEDQAPSIPSPEPGRRAARRAEAGMASPGAPLIPPPASARRRPTRTPLLDRYGRDLTALAHEGRIDPVIGRQDEIRRVIQILARKGKSNPVIIGEAGVGKTAVVYGLALRIARGEVPQAMRDRRLIELNMASIVAGARHRGEFEERLQQVIQEVEDSFPDIILFVDELHTIMGAGDSRGAMDAGNLLKPALARGRFPCVGATTTDEFRRHIEKDEAMARRFQPVMVEEPSEEDTLRILEGLRDYYESHHGVRFGENAFRAAVKLSVRYLPDRNLPDKAIDVIDEAAARLKTHSVSLSGERGELVVSEETVSQVISLWTGIPVVKLTLEESERLLKMEDLLRGRIIGQDEAVGKVAETIRMVRMGLGPTNRPGGVFLFLGPTGVGKTELAKALAEYLFGSEREIIRLDMSEFMEKHSISRLIGSPPGYVGYDEEGQLTRQVRTKPYSVVLLDEIEKAHPEVFDLFLQVFDDGRLSDSKGRAVNFTNTIIIMTSNLGVGQDDGAGGIRHVNLSIARERERVLGILRKTFRPEFLNRIDEIIFFRHLDKDDLEAILELQLRELRKRLREKDIELEVDPSGVDFLLQEGYHPAFGARPLKRAIQNLLAKPLSRELLEGRFSPGATVVAWDEDGVMTFGLPEQAPEYEYVDDDDDDDGDGNGEVEPPPGEPPVEAENRNSHQTRIISPPDEDHQPPAAQPGG